MIEHIYSPLSRHVLTKLIEEEKRERIQIVSNMVDNIRWNEKGVHEYGKYLLAIEDDKIQIVTPKTVYIKLLYIH